MKVDFSPQKTNSNVWRDFWLSYWRRGALASGGDSQGSFTISYNAWTAHPNKEIISLKCQQC
jgi:hypothetical protein